ncbi:carbohydrate kinase [Intrasporangium oryzae NRRL B-24470]|uniref:Bifunctional NAD(P)H-hydrate repair enzyme n=1 Tax=Intrasporangium oryzae NRRL B-24470 TaxID=1386089 RepID=W9G4E1_9MICO|nr:bifunctional ADP-dependent NAD(P)H-hydrate dehydratase/NAD(P)H-hydrate epimerase [Intrasporangium oryzae]EWS99657.1 carbohydrate kinase [Intrasporangium oryzae NRRL B-24470]
MIRAHRVEDVRAAEAAAMAALPEGELMARASEGLAEVAAARLAERDGRTVVALVGPGNNGGDTLYAAGLLSEAGFACVAVLVTPAGRASVHAEALAAAEEAGVAVVVPADDPAAAAALVGEGDLVLDGIVGIGGRPGLHDEAARMVDAIDDDAWVLAVDLASGLDPCGESGDDEAVWADETVTFGTPKPAHLLPAGEGATGRLTVVDIGLDLDDVPAAVERLTYDDVALLWPVPGPADDKYSRGVLGVVAGGESYTGAAILSVTAAAESGAGMIRYVGTPTPTGLVRAAVPEAVHGEGRVQAWLIGPGLDVSAEGEAARAQLDVARTALASDEPVVLDAGGLDLLDPGALPRTAPTLLTPHAGELARLLSRLDAPSGARDATTGETPSVTRADVEGDPLGHARRLAARTGATVLLKGSTTLVVDPDLAAPVRSQADAPAWLATAGAGDVLSGVVGTLLASGLKPLDAGSLGALVHGVTADRVSAGGPLRALAVAHGIRPTVRDLLARGRSAPE